eukprot:gene15409-18276_t
MDPQSLFVPFVLIHQLLRKYQQLYPPYEKSELRSVAIIRAKKYEEGDSIQMQLLQYREGTTVPYLSSQEIPMEISFPNTTAPNSLYSRFSILYDIQHILEAERQALDKAKLIAMSEGEEITITFIANAEKEVDEREKQFHNLVETREEGNIRVTSIPKKRTIEFENYQYSNNPDIKYALETYYTDNSFFLHPLCMKILSRDAQLREEMNEEAAVTLPPIIKSKVLEIESLEVTKKVRAQHRALNIVALTTSISFVEVDLTSYVSKRVLDEFYSELSQRREVRNAKKRTENRKQRNKEKEREHDIKRSKEIRETYEKEMEVEKERKRIQKEKEDAEDAERLKNEGPVKQNKGPSFLAAIKSYKSHDEEFGFSLGESTKKHSKGK